MRFPVVRPLVVLVAAAVCTPLMGAAPALAAAPVPSFTVSGGDLNVGAPVTFTSTSTDPDGDALTESWDFDGDGTFEATGASVQHTFGSAGTVNVALTVADAAGESAGTSKAIAILAPPPPPPLPAPPMPAPPLANAPPSASFTISDETPAVGQAVTLTSTSADGDGTIAAEDWDLDGDGRFDEATGTSVTWAFSRFGTQIVRLRVRDSSGAEMTATRTVAVNQPPSASFTAAPAVVIAGEPVAFASTSHDADGTIARLAWSLDGDDVFDDGTTSTISRRYTTPGEVVVRLQATDNDGASMTATVIVSVVADRPPIASFSFAPAAPQAGEPVTFASNSSDPDGTLTGLSWDLDGDGFFDDAAGATVVQSFRTNGSFVVALRATDNRGASSVAFQTVVVRGSVTLQDAEAGPPSGTSAPSSNPPSSSSRPGTRFNSPGGAPRATRLLMSPFPIVRIRGRALGSKVTINLLSIRAAGGARVLVRCKGKGCPRKQASARAVSAKRPVRLRSLERVYSPGAVLEVYVTKPGRIGKYVRFKIRNGAAPTRDDGCLSTRRMRTVKCPG